MKPLPVHRIRSWNSTHIPFPGAKAETFQENYINTMSTDALATWFAMPSAAVVVNM